MLLTASCGSNKDVYWCGDHPCLNNKEKKAYFKKNMVIEMKSAKKTDYKNNSEIEQIMQEAQEKEKIRIKNDKNALKQKKLEEKKRIKEEKKLAKQIRSEEKKRVKEEKKLAKQTKLDKKQKVKIKKKLSTKKINDNNKKQLVKTEISSSKFSEIVEVVTRKNTFKPYPDINDIPN